MQPERVSCLTRAIRQHEECGFRDDITLLLQAEAIVTEPRPHLLWQLGLAIQQEGSASLVESACGLLPAGGDLCNAVPGVQHAAGTVAPEKQVK